MDVPTDRLPLVIGVTGHRDLRERDVPKLEQAVADVIAGLRRDYLGGDRKRPIIVLSALAEGADRLVARVALAQGAQLLAPLPLPADEYRRDFEPGLVPGNVAEFDALLAQAIAAPVMSFTPGNSLEAVRVDRDKRNEQYRAVGIFIIQHCHVLLALWDERTEDAAAGGSAEIVSFKRGGIPLEVSASPRASLDGTEIGPVIDIVTPRVKQTSTVEEVEIRPWGKALVKRHRRSAHGRWHRVAEMLARLVRHELDDGYSKLPNAERRELETWESFEALIELNQTFNRDADRLAGAPDGGARVAQSIDELFTDPEQGSLDAAARSQADTLAPRWCRLYGLADVLARQRQVEFRLDWKLLFVFGFVAFACFAMFAHLGHGEKPFMAGYIISCIAAFMLFARAKRGRHQERYLDYRALAEALRVAVYWKLIGIGSQRGDGAPSAANPRGGIDRVDTIADGYPIGQPSELAWVKTCLRTIERLDKVDGARSAAADATGHAIARRHWVYGQYAYFKRQGYRHNSLAETIEAYSTILLLLSPLVFTPLLLFDLVSNWRGFDVKHAFVVAIGLLPGLAAAFGGYAERLAMKAQARQYDRMRMLFERAYELLPERLDERPGELVRGLYQELGMEAMKESAEWVAIYRQRPIQPLQ
jgi:hypothetical protein